jgi:hypothetical protein
MHAGAAALAFCLATGCSEVTRTVPSPHAGLDPFATGCAHDAETASRAAVRDPTGRIIGVVDVRWSPSCHTAWTRIARFDGQGRASLAGGISTPAGGARSFLATGGLALWTDMVPCPDTCAVATATLYGDDDAPLGEARVASCRAPSTHSGETANR